ncbi:MAG: 2-oxoacid:acceptor oxidoreductase family protein [Deltaproteobacteria bacterium]|nr:2-oxoacid:acceptor oxidoreductase family protein [Deltaproteobacteria bacterium]MBW2018188.1 2-oxoacid:acceptor oxidoreductase family protein [Deltaproteobacteria bacterium]MBW2129913.1 2-oxoacid:acceptor oxidoreductase family protein [Deltaproteobacteria bacterium]MBW2305246.1 2-oxoacid:acceptor oxidoreductase family protein [Deltaproteobacteria bacterium]
MTKKTVFAGFGGQGVLMMGYLTALSAMLEGKNVTYLPSYGAEVRGGTANCTVVVSDEEIFSPVASTPDYAVIMNRPSLAKYEGSIREGGLIALNSSLVDRDPTRDDITVLKIPANDMARELGSDRTINMIMLGAFVAKTGITTLEAVMQGLEEIVKGKKAKLMELNRKGLNRGAQYVLKGA